MRKDGEQQLAGHADDAAKPSRSSQGRFVAPGQSWSDEGHLEQPVMDIRVKQVLTTPLPEPRLQDNSRSKLFGSHLIGPGRSGIITNELGECR
jgi:hypothetical protein